MLLVSVIVSQNPAFIGKQLFLIFTLKILAYKTSGLYGSMNICSIKKVSNLDSVLQFDLGSLAM